MKISVLANFVNNSTAIIQYSNGEFSLNTIPIDTKDIRGIYVPITKYDDSSFSIELVCITPKAFKKYYNLLGINNE